MPGMETPLSLWPTTATTPCEIRPCSQRRRLIGVGRVVGGNDLDLLAEHAALRVHFVGGQLRALPDLDAPVGSVSGVGCCNAHLDDAGEGGRWLGARVATRKRKAA